MKKRADKGAFFIVVKHLFCKHKAISIGRRIFRHSLIISQKMSKYLADKIRLEYQIPIWYNKIYNVSCVQSVACKRAFLRKGGICSFGG